MRHPGELMQHVCFALTHLIILGKTNRVTALPQTLHGSALTTKLLGSTPMGFSTFLGSLIPHSSPFSHCLTGASKMPGFLALRVFYLPRC